MQIWPFGAEGPSARHLGFVVDLGHGIAAEGNRLAPRDGEDFATPGDVNSAESSSIRKHNGHTLHASMYFWERVDALTNVARESDHPRSIGHRQPDSSADHRIGARIEARTAASTT
jgi:hypothetical protein